MFEEMKLDSSRNIKKYCFPDEWQLVELGEIFSLQQGKALSQKNQTGKFGQPFLRTANILWGHLDLSNVDQMDFTEDEMNRFALKPRDLLICEGGEIGRTAIWSGQIEPCFHQNHIHRLRLLRGDVEPEFVMYWMQAAIRLLGLYEGEGNKTTIPNLSKARLSKFLVPMPPLPEQRAIALTLHAVQGAREARLREMALEKERKAALMEHLFTKGTRGEATKQTEIGEMPERWEITKLGNISEISSGGTPSRDNQEYWNGNIPWVKTGEIHYNTIIDTEEKITQRGLENSAAKTIPKGTLLMAMYGQGVTRGKVSLLGISATINQACAAILVRNGFYTKFLFYYLEYSYERIRNFGHGANQKNLNLDLVRSITASMPEISEQKEIATILLACDSKITALEHEARLLQELFRAMLEELMNGQLSCKGEISTNCGE